MSASAQGGGDLWYTGGGARQLRILDAKDNPKSVADLLDLGMLQGWRFLLDFVEHFAQAVRAAWGDQVRGSLEPGDSLVVYPSSAAAEPFGVYFDHNTYSFYTHERGSRVGPEFQSDDVSVIQLCLTLCVGNALRVTQGFEKLALYNTAPIRSGWTMVPSTSAGNPGFTGIRSDRGVFYPCARANRWLLAGLSHVVEYSPLDVLECYLREDAAPLLSQWLSKSAG